MLNTSTPGITQEFLSQVSEENEGRVTEKPSQEVSRRESRILDALSKLDEFLLNPQLPTFSGTVLGTFWKADVENQESSRIVLRMIPILKWSFLHVMPAV